MGYSAQGSLAGMVDLDLFREMQRRTVKRVGDELHRLTVEHTPVAKPPPGVEAEWLAARKRAPGTLKESWKVGEVTIDVGTESMSIEVYTRDPIAPHVEWPTMPHIILPRRPGGWLRFWNKYGDTIYARIVHHPGTQGSYMLTTSLEEVRISWEAMGGEELDAWAREQTARIGL